MIGTLDVNRSGIALGADLIRTVLDGIATKGILITEPLMTINGVN